MLSFATEISKLAHDIGYLDTIAVKIASADGSALAQNTTAETSFHLYSVITKTAEDFQIQPTVHHVAVLNLLDKVAHILRKPALIAEMRCKLASVVIIDDALTETLKDTTDVVERQKLAEVQVYGREFFTELLRNII